MSDRDSARCRIAGGVIALAWGYLSAVLLLDEPALPFAFGSALWWAGSAAAGLAAWAGLAWLLRRRPTAGGHLVNLTLLVGVTLGSLVALDVAFSVYLNLSRPPPESIFEQRAEDRNVWIGELYPKLYYPTERNFRLQKPGTHVAGSDYGAFYRPAMLASPTLTGSVLQRERVRIDIDENGFRETTPLERARVFALGDSFTFGWGVDAEDAWPERLERATGWPVYNLGIHDASPLQELELLEYVLRTHATETAQVRRLVWMIYEGNDLEDSYAPRHPRSRDGRGWIAEHGTLLELVAMLPHTIHREAAITRLRSGELELRRAGGLSRDPYLVDGVRLEVAYYESPTLGGRLFLPRSIERARAGPGYVSRHPNLPRLRAVFEEMAALAAEHDLDVTVALAPTAARLQGPFFTGFPEISAEPYFLDTVADLARGAGFRVVDLYRALAPHADRELLYLRDDGHPNERGHERIAQILAREIPSPGR